MIHLILLGAQRSAALAEERAFLVDPMPTQLLLVERVRLRKEDNGFVSCICSSTIPFLSQDPNRGVEDSVQIDLDYYYRAA